MATSITGQTPSGNVACDLINNFASLSKLIDVIKELPITQSPSLYVDLEGEDLSRNGTISILQVYVLPTKHTYLIDIHTLGRQAFTTCGLKSHCTFKEILESEQIAKVFFDVRNDSDALYSHFGIRLSGIQDLQLMELATRNFSKKYVSGLAKCIERDGCLSAAESKTWKECKEAGVRLFAPERGGSYAVFNERPLSKEIVQYCAQDVHFLPRLWEQYNRKLTPKWALRVMLAVDARVKESQSAGYVPHGRQKALAPPHWDSM